MHACMVKKTVYRQPCVCQRLHINLTQFFNVPLFRLIYGRKVFAFQNEVQIKNGDTIIGQLLHWIGTLRHYFSG